MFIKTKYFFGDASKLWLVFICCGIFAWVSPVFFPPNIPTFTIISIGLISVSIGIILKMTYYGLELDKEKQRIRRQTSILGIKKGRWKTMPNFQRISLDPRKSQVINMANGISPTFYGQHNSFSILLFADDTLPEYSINIVNKNDAIQQAEELSDLLKIPLENHC